MPVLAGFQAELDALRLRENAPTREGDAIAAARRRLPMVEVDSATPLPRYPATPLTGEHGPGSLLETFEGRRQGPGRVAGFLGWDTGAAAPPAGRPGTRRAPGQFPAPLR